MASLRRGDGGSVLGGTMPPPSPPHLVVHAWSGCTLLQVVVPAKQKKWVALLGVVRNSSKHSGNNCGDLIMSMQLLPLLEGHFIPRSQMAEEPGVPL